jgi:hypothetical protein
MMLFDAEGKIKRYDSPEQILQEFFDLRLQYYEKRRVALLQVGVIPRRKSYALPKPCTAGGWHIQGWPGTLTIIQRSICCPTHGAVANGCVKRGGLPRASSRQQGVEQLWQDQLRTTCTLGGSRHAPGMAQCSGLLVFVVAPARCCQPHSYHHK